MAIMTAMLLLFIALALGKISDRAMLPKKVGIVLITAYCLYYLVLWSSITTH
jgi:Ca2+/Na+ antiporter